MSGSDVWKQRIVSIFKRQAVCCMSGSWRLGTAYSLHMQASSCLLYGPDVRKQRIASIFKRQAVRCKSSSYVWKRPIDLYSNVKLSVVWVVLTSGSNLLPPENSSVKLSVYEHFPTFLTKLFASSSTVPQLELLGPWAYRHFVSSKRLQQWSHRHKVTFQKSWVLSNTPMRKSNFALPKTIDSLWKTAACLWRLSCRYSKLCTIFTPDYLTLLLFHTPPPTGEEFPSVWQTSHAKILIKLRNSTFGQVCSRSAIFNLILRQ